MRATAPSNGALALTVGGLRVTPSAPSDNLGMRSALASVFSLTLAITGCIEPAPPSLPSAPDDVVDEPQPPTTGEIAGTFCNARTGATVLGGVVTLTLPSGALTVSTDESSGFFLMEDVPAGIHVLVVEDDGVRSNIEVEVEGGVQTVIDPGECTPYDPLTTGVILGAVCLPDGAPAAGARVFIVEPIDGLIYESDANDLGEFIIAGIPTPQLVSVRAERGLLVFTWNAVPVFSTAESPDGTELTAAVGCQPLVPNDSRRVLVVDGPFENLDDSLSRAAVVNVDRIDGTPADITESWATTAFANLDALAQYDAVLVESGVSETSFVTGMSIAERANLRAFVEEGGSLYVSGWAYDLVEDVFPEAIAFLNDDTETSAAEQGVAGTYTARIREPGFANAIGDDTLELTLTPSFTVVEEVAAGVTVILDADVDVANGDGTTSTRRAPLAVRFQLGAGTVLFNAVDCFSENGTSECNANDTLTQHFLFSL